MFTGLIEELGTVGGIQRASDGIFLTVFGDLVLEDAKIGDSVSINGACQTVTSLQKDRFTVFVSRITEEITTLGSLKQGIKVNLERAMSHESRFGGHIVQGHVDGTGRVKSIKADENGIEVEIATEKDLLNYVVEKGSIAVDGISLTVVSMSDSSFVLYLIPETLNKTNIKLWSQGTMVNLETDILAKYVEKMMSNQKDKKGEDDKRLMGKLFEEGYM